MKLATLADGSRDGRLIVVHTDHATYAQAHDIAPTLQVALDHWDTLAPRLRERSAALHAGQVDARAVELSQLRAPLPRAYEWVDGSAFLNHVELVRAARGAEPPPTLRTDPLVYQGGSGVLLGPTDDLELPDPEWGLDFEGEVAVVLGDTPRGTTAAEAHRYVKLLLLCNDVTYRNHIPRELAKGFGFFQSKPATAFSPFAVTPDEIHGAWDGRAKLRLTVRVNGQIVGSLDCGPEMHFSFYDLVEHICRTRSFTAGTLLGSGTVSNRDPDAGVSCLAERRMREIIADGAPKTGFLEAGDVVELEMHHGAHSVFGPIRQRVVAP